MPKNKLWKRVSALFLMMVMLVSALPAQVMAAASYGTFSFQRLGVTYQFDSSFPSPFGDTTRTKQFNAYYVNQDDTGSMKQAYCIQYGVDVSTGSQLTRQDSYSEMTTAQKTLLNKVLVFGYNEQSGTKYGGTWTEETMATQAMVWMVSTGYYGTSWETSIVDTILASSTKARSIYNTIRANVESYDTIPSFTGSTASAATEHELKYNTTTGKYEITLTDTNAVLSQFDFSGSGVSFTRSGNKLTITTDQVLENATFTANKNLPRDTYPTLINGSPEYWTHSTWQNLASLNVEGEAPKVAAVLKLSTEKTGHINLLKESEDGIVSGLKFRITGNGVDQTVTTGSDGSILVENLLAGDYSITEVDTPNRYVQPSTQVVTVEPGRTTSVSFDNILKKFYIYITKSDTETGSTAQGDATLDGAVYEIYDSSGNFVERITAEGNTAKSSLLVLGTYTIYEVEPPTGYNINENPVTVTGDFDGQTVEIGRADTGIQDAVIKGQVVLAKFADKPLTGDSDDGGLKTPLAGVDFTFTLVSTGEIAATITTDEDGYAITPLLPYGTYLVEEVQSDANEGYRLIEPFEVTIDTHSKIYKYILEDTVYESEIKIIKTDAETGNTIPLAGTTFKIKDSDGNWVTQKINYPTPTVLEAFETAEDGTLVLPYPLPAGDYWLYETIAPYGYTVAEEPIKFTVSSDNQSVLLEVVAANTPVKGTITIEKLGEYLTGFEETEDETHGTIYSPIYKTKGVPGTVYDVVAVTDIVTPDGTLRAEAGTVLETLTTGTDGRATSGELYLGQYQLIERSVPNGYVLDETPIPFELTYEDQNTALVSEIEWQENDRQKALITLNKDAEMLDNQSYNPYPDIVFGLYSGVEFVNSAGDVVLEADSLMEVITLNEDGTGAFTSDLPFADYYVKELEVGTGYYLNGDTYEFTLSHEDTTTPVVEITVGGEDGIYNELMRGELRITKTVEGDDTLEGFTFRIAGTTINGTDIEIIADTDENGEIHITDIPLGKYEVTELATDRAVGYILPDSQTVTVELNDPAELTFENLLIYGGFALEKVDADDHDKRLDGAVFGLYTADGELLDEFTAEDGTYSMDGLLFGAYYLLEHVAPEGYELAENPFMFTISEHEEIIEITAENERSTGGVRLLKVDFDNHDSKLEGAVFDLYSAESDELIGSYTTDSQGILEVDELKYGDYYFVETTSPEGYELDSTPIPFTIDDETTEDGMELVCLTVTNEATPDPTGGVRLTKVDADDEDTVLEGAVFDLYSAESDELIGSYTTNKQGLIELDGLLYGDYYFVETTAPDGYELDSTPIPFTLDSDTTQDGTVLVELTAVNTAAPVDEPEDEPEETGETPEDTTTATTTTTSDTGKGDSPKTGDDTSLLLPILLLLGGTAGLMITLAVKRKKSITKGK